MDCCIISTILILTVLYQGYKYFRWVTCKPDFTGKTVFITGGSSGIGEELAKRFIELNAKEVVIAARTVKELERVKSECKHPERVKILQMDLSNPEQCLKQAEEYIASGSRVDILINNGGRS